MKRMLVILFTLTLLFSLIVPAFAAVTVYGDVASGAWYETAVAYCTEHNIMAGTDGTHFSPTQPVTRALTASLLYYMAGSPAVSGSVRFSDVPTGASYAKAVSWAAETGVTTGVGKDAFAPDTTLTRQQFATFLWRMAGEPSASSGSKFPDRASISSWAANAAAWANEERIITGRPGGNFDPNATLNRAEAAAILMRYDQSVPRSLDDRVCAANGVARIEDGSLLVTDIRNHQIWKLGSDGMAALYAGASTTRDLRSQPLGGSGDAALRSAMFHTPWAIAPYDAGWVVTDTDNGMLRLLADGEVKTIQRSLSRPTGLAADDQGNLYIAETGRGTIRKLNAAGQLSILASGLAEPTGLCWKNGILYVAETGADRITTVGPDGDASVLAGSGDEGYADGSTASAAFSAPLGVAVGEDGTVYVADTGNRTIRRIRDGQVDTVAVHDPASSEMTLIRPVGLMVQGSTLYICDSFARVLLTIPVDS